jgi:2,5-dihydroxypyridine 5,6-dioxygenase
VIDKSLSADKTAASIRHLLTNCGSLREGERVAVIYDPTTRALGVAFAREASLMTTRVSEIEIPVATRHGQQPPDDGAAKMLGADLIISLCQFSLAHTNARIEAGKRGARFLSMPCYSWELLRDPAVLVDFQHQGPVVRSTASAFTAGTSVQVTTRAGTDIRLDIAGRIGNACPGRVEQPGDLGSPPDIEANVSPVEDRSEGTIVVDGSVTCPEIGLLKTPVFLTVHTGRIASIASEDQGYVDVLERMLGGPTSPRRVLAELGIGLNPAARLTGTMLTDEGALGCIHVGFGSNSTVGGTNEADFHLDFVLRSASIFVDDVPLMLKGELIA